MRFIKYIGLKPKKSDNVAGTGLSWEPGQTHAVDNAAGAKLLAHKDVWVEDTDQANESASLTGLQTLESTLTQTSTTKTPEQIEAEREQEAERQRQEMAEAAARFPIDTATKAMLTGFAKKTFGVDLQDKAVKDMRTDVQALIQKNSPARG